MIDIVLKLKDHYAAKDTDAWMSCIDAADEIERLRAEMAGDKILEDCEMHDPVWAAIAGVWGKRCEDFEEGCPCCRAWAEYDKVTRLTAENERLRAALEKIANVKPFYGAEADEMLNISLAALEGK